MTWPIEPLRGAVIGCGRMGSLHARRLAARDDVRLLALIDPRCPEDPALAALHRAALPPIDFAVIAAPTALHVALAEPLLAAGVACLVEKPMAPTAEEAARIAHYPRLCVAHIERWNPAIRAIVGAPAPRFLRAERLAPFGPRSLDVDVVHDLDLALWLGGGEVTEIRAVGVPMRTSGVDIADARIELSSGCVAQLVASRVSRVRSRTLRTMAPGVYWSLDLAKPSAERVRWGEGDLSGEPVPLSPQDALGAMHDAFLAAVRGEAPFPVSGAEGLQAVALADKVAALALARL